MHKLITKNAYKSKIYSQIVIYKKYWRSDLIVNNDFTFVFQALLIENDPTVELFQQLGRS